MAIAMPDRCASPELLGTNYRKQIVQVMTATVSPRIASCLLLCHLDSSTAARLLRGWRYHRLKTSHPITHADR
jgi:hypothetical protein